MTSSYWAILIISIVAVGVIIWWHRHDIWSKLPDECEVEGCLRAGIRGNENIIKGIIMCDYCHARAMEGHPIRLKRKNHGTRSQ